MEQIRNSSTKNPHQTQPKTSEGKNETKSFVILAFCCSCWKLWNDGTQYRNSFDHKKNCENSNFSFFFLVITFVILHRLFRQMDYLCTYRVCCFNNKNYVSWMQAMWGLKTCVSLTIRRIRRNNKQNNRERKNPWKVGKLNPNSDNIYSARAYW